MSKVVGVRIHATQIVSVFYHGEYQTFWQNSEYSIIHRQRSRTASKCEGLEFDSG